MGGGGSGSNLARFSGLACSSSSARLFIALGGGGGLSELFGRCLSAGRSIGISVRCRLDRTASELGESERSLGGFNGVPWLSRGIIAGEGGRSFSLPLLEIATVFGSSAGASWPNTLGPSTPSRVGTLTLPFFVWRVAGTGKGVALAVGVIITLDETLVCTISGGQVEDTVEIKVEAEDPERRGERRGVCVSGGANVPSETKAGIDISQSVLMLSIDDVESIVWLSGPNPRSEILRDEWLGSSSGLVSPSVVTVNTGIARSGRVLVLGL